MLSNKSGSSVLTTPIIIAFGIMIVTVLLLLVVEVIMPYLWYEKLSSTSIKYVYLMEEFGYLTNKEANLLKDDLENQGFKMKNINIEIQSIDDSLAIQRAVYRDIFRVLSKSDIDYVIKKARGNNKVAMILALGDIKEE